jgi:tRNA (guanine-N7-)-methyltransferase
MENIEEKNEKESIEELSEELNVKREVVCLPQKRYYRQRAHSNPIADHCFEYPSSPESIDWSIYYPNISPDSNQSVEFADIGCGYGGLLIELSQMFPNILMLGIEIRVKVCDFVCDRIKALRQQNSGQFNNIYCIRSNAMKYLVNYFRKSQLSKMFFLFPDPHFKKQKHKWRIISQQLLAEYAFCLKINGLVYIATDVKELYEWMTNHFIAHPLFQSLEQHEIDSDLIVPKLFDSTEEGKKVTRNGGQKFIAVFRRIEDNFQV